MYYSHYWVISNSWTIVDTFCKATRIPWLCSLCIYKYLDHVQCVWLGWTLIKTIYNQIYPQICTQENWIKINQLYLSLSQNVLLSKAIQTHTCAPQYLSFIHQMSHLPSTNFRNSCINHYQTIRLQSKAFFVTWKVFLLKVFWLAKPLHYGCWLGWEW